MRPDILNPLFAEVEVLKGIGPALAKPLHRLKLDRVVDILFHLPVSWIDRKKVARLDVADVGRVITVALTPRDYRQGGRGPFRVFAEDEGGDYITLTYFNNLIFNLLFRLGNYLFNPGRMDTTISYQTMQGKAGYFTSYRIKS